MSGRSSCPGWEQSHPSNRLKSVKPDRCMQVTEGNTEGKIGSSSDPRNDSDRRERSLDEVMVQLHNTPALDQAVDLGSYISGFVDGEGCFCVSFQPSQTTPTRLGSAGRVFRSARTWSEPSCSRSSEIFGAADSIRPDRSDRTIKFEVRNVRHLSDKGVAALSAISAHIVQANRMWSAFEAVCRVDSARRAISNRRISKDRGGPRWR